MSVWGPYSWQVNWVFILQHKRGIHRFHASEISEILTLLDVTTCGRSEFCDRHCTGCPAITAWTSSPHLLLTCLMLDLYKRSFGKKILGGVIFQHVNLFLEVNHWLNLQSLTAVAIAQPACPPPQVKKSSICNNIFFKYKVTHPKLQFPHKRCVA